MTSGKYDVLGESTSMTKWHYLILVIATVVILTLIIVNTVFAAQGYKLTYKEPDLTQFDDD